jgi:hypothetical protein
MKHLITLAACFAVVGGLAPRASAQAKNDRDDRHGIDWIPHISHVPLHFGGTDPHTPKGVPPETVVPSHEFRYSSPRFSAFPSEGGSAIARGLSGWRGRGILAGIGGGLAALFGGLFGRKKES